VRVDVAAAPQPRGRAARDTHPTELARLAAEEAADPAVDPLAIQSVIWLFRAYSAVAGAQAAVLRPYGLSPSAFNVLMALSNTPERLLEPCELAERLLVSRPSMSGLLDTLEGKGMVRRRVHPQDRRRVLVSLTDEGARLATRALRPVHAELEEVFSALDADELDDLVGALRRVRGAAPADLAPGVGRRAATAAGAGPASG
jgi:DNA-binding MarR family transcriptional regulator